MWHDMWYVQKEGEVFVAVDEFNAFFRQTASKDTLIGIIGDNRLIFVQWERGHVGSNGMVSAVVVG